MLPAQADRMAALVSVSQFLYTTGSLLGQRRGNYLYDLTLSIRLTRPKQCSNGWPIVLGSHRHPGRRSARPGSVLKRSTPNRNRLLNRRVSRLGSQFSSIRTRRSDPSLSSANCPYRSVSLWIRLNPTGDDCPTHRDHCDEYRLVS